MGNTTFVMLVGLPGSGKSTWVSKHGIPAECVYSTDAIVEQYAKSVGKTYNDVWNDYVKHATKIMNFALQSAIRMHKPKIVIDQTNLSIKSRQAKLNMIEQFYENDFDKRTIGSGMVMTNTGLVPVQKDRVIKKAIVFDTDYSIIEERLENRAKMFNKTIPENVMKIMRDSFEEPTFDEGFDSIDVIRNYDGW